MGNKYREPWVDGQCFGVQMLVSKADDQHIVMSGEIRQRIADCVNACAGMDDPVMEVAKLKDKSTENALQNEYMKAALNSLMGLLCDASDSGDHGKSLESIVTYGKSILTGGADLTALKKAVDNVFIIEFKPYADEDSCAYDFSNTKNFGGLEKIPSWHELGIFPPVGTECEINEPKMSRDGRKVHVFAHYNGLAFAWDDVEQAAYHSDDPSEFRPIQTEKQKIIKEMLYCFDGFFNGDGDNAGQVCEKIYDQFIAKK